MNVATGEFVIFIISVFVSVQEVSVLLVVYVTVYSPALEVPGVITPVEGSYTYDWTVPTGTAPANTVSTFNPTAAGQYSVVITNTTTGCASQIANATLIVNALPSAPVITPNGPTTFCQGGSVILSSSTANGYAWSNQATSQTITVSSF